MEDKEKLRRESLSIVTKLLYQRIITEKEGVTLIETIVGNNEQPIWVDYPYVCPGYTYTPYFDPLKYYTTSTSTEKISY